jgi:hypothetical protein
MRTSSDAYGYFETGYTFSYACTPFELEISAPGYAKQRLTFYPPLYGFDDELPEIVTVTLQAR